MGAGNDVPWWGLGQSPKQGMGWQPHRNPVPIKKEVVSEQNAKHSTIETGLRRKACLYMQSGLNHPLHTPAMQSRVTPCGGWGYAPALQAGERAPLGLRGLGEDFDFSP